MKPRHYRKCKDLAHGYGCENLRCIRVRKHDVRGHQPDGFRLVHQKLQYRSESVGLRITPISSDRLKCPMKKGHLLPLFEPSSYPGMNPDSTNFHYYLLLVWLHFNEIVSITGEPLNYPIDHSIK